MNKIWSDAAWDDYLYWQGEDRKMLKKINNLIKAVEREPYTGLGKPEPLRYYDGDVWSRQIDQKNRLVYRMVEAGMEIIACKTHYGDK